MMLSTLFVVLLALGLNSLSRVLGQEEEECGCSTSVFVDIPDLLQYYSRCSYATHKLNVDCLLSGCPSLSGVCPLTSNGSIDQCALTAAVSILNTCIGQDGLICDINMSRTPLPLVSWSLDQLVPATVANGSASILPGTAFLYNLSTATFALPPPADSLKGLITLLILAPHIVHAGQGSCNLSLGPASFGRAIPLPATTLTIPAMSGVIRLNLSHTVSIDLSAGPSPCPALTTLEAQCQVRSEYSNLLSQEGVEAPPTVLQPLNDLMNGFLKDSVLASTTTTFLSTYAALGLRAAQLNCPPQDP